MSLSNLCFKQHEQNQARLKQLLLWGLLGSVGVHAIALGLSQFNFGQVATDEITPIELIVTDSLTEPLSAEPEVLPDPTQPAELSTQTNDPAVTTASAPPRAAVVAPPAPVTSPVEPVAVDIPAPLEDTQTESALEELRPTAEDEPTLGEEEPTETAEEILEKLEPEAVATEPSDSQAERLRDLLQRLRDSQADAGPSNADAPTESATANGGTVPDAPVGDRQGVAAAPSTTNGSGQGQGPRTVACQTCVRPSYPQSALAAGAEGQPMVRVDINPDGSVRSVTLTRSSGNAEIDQAAIQAARNSRFQPVAGGASVPIEYDLTIDGSRRNRDARRRGERQTVEVPTEPTSTAETADRPPAAATSPRPDGSSNGADDAPATPASPTMAPPAEIEPSVPEPTEPKPTTTAETAPIPPAAPSQGSPPAPEPTSFPSEPPPVAPPPIVPPALAAPVSPPPAPASPIPAAPPVQ